MTGAIIILIVVLAVLGIAGAAVWALAARGRQKQLSAKGGSLDAGREPPGAPEQERPEHVAVENDEQRTRFAGTRSES